jgi:hypothetical protein
MRIGNVELTEGPNLQFYVVTIILAAIDLWWGLYWVAFWLLVLAAIIIYGNLQGEENGRNLTGEGVETEE